MGCNRVCFQENKTEKLFDTQNKSVRLLIVCHLFTPIEAQRDAELEGLLQVHGLSQPQLIKKIHEGFSTMVDFGRAAWGKVKDVIGSSQNKITRQAVRTAWLDARRIDEEREYSEYSESEAELTPPKKKSRIEEEGGTGKETFKDMFSSDDENGIFEDFKKQTSSKILKPKKVAELESSFSKRSGSTLPAWLQPSSKLVSACFRARLDKELPSLPLSAIKDKETELKTACNNASRKQSIIISDGKMTIGEDPEDADNTGTISPYLARDKLMIFVNALQVAGYTTDESQWREHIIKTQRMGTEYGRTRQQQWLYAERLAREAVGRHYLMTGNIKEAMERSASERDEIWRKELIEKAPDLERMVRRAVSAVTGGNPQRSENTQRGVIPQRGQDASRDDHDNGPPTPMNFWTASEKAGCKWNNQTTSEKFCFDFNWHGKCEKPGCAMTHKCCLTACNHETCGGLSAAHPEVKAIISAGKGAGKGAKGKGKGKGGKGKGRGGRY